MEFDFAIVTVKDGRAIKSQKVSGIETSKDLSKYVDKKPRKDGSQDFVIPLGKKDEATVVTVSRENPRYCTFGKPVKCNEAIEEEKYNDFLHNRRKNGLNSFVVTDTGKVLDTEF